MGLAARIGFVVAVVLVVVGVALWSIPAGLVVAGLLCGVLVALFTIEV